MITNFFNTIARISILAMVSLLCNCCIPHYYTNQGCKSISLISSFQLLKVDNNQLFSIGGSLNIFYCDNYILFQLPQNPAPTTADNNNGGDITMKKVKVEETKCAYVIYNKKYNYGYLFDSLSIEKPRVISIDSFLTMRTFKKFPFYLENNVSLVEASRNKINHTLIEKYIYKDKKDISYADTIYYFYRKGFKNIEYSFSKKLDSIKKLKLYSVRLIYNKVPKGNHGMDIPKREFLFEIENNNSYSNKIVDFINRFKEKESSMPYSKRQQ